MAQDFARHEQPPLAERTSPDAVRFQEGAINHATLESYLREVDHLFPVPVSSRRDLTEYAKKLEAEATCVSAWCGARLVGLNCLYLDMEDSPEGFLAQIAVSDDLTGHGIGRELVRRGLRLAKERGKSRLRLEVHWSNRRAMRLYRSLGFVTEQQAGEDSVYMVADLFVAGRRGPAGKADTVARVQPGTSERHETSRSVLGNYPAFRWFELDDPVQRRAYHQIWKETQSRRPHDHPGFLSFMPPEGFRSAAAVYRHAPGTLVLYPFHYRDLSTHPAFSDHLRPVLHLISPYGYGGPLYEGGQADRETATRAFLQHFASELGDRGVVSEFVREDIFSSRIVPCVTGERLVQQPNVVVRLERHPDEIWTHYKHKVRKNVNRARKNGLRIEFESTGQRLDEFFRLYHETMVRTGASSQYLTSLERFASLITALSEDDALHFAHVFHGDAIVSTELFLMAPDAFYSFLGGTATAAFDLRPNDLLKHEAILWGISQGLKSYVLGGGATPEDGIFRYKSAFDPGGVVPFRVRRIVHDKEAYASLISERTEYERGREKAWRPRDDFFPKYLS